MREGVYPYDYVDYLENLDETSLPPKEAFHSKRTGEDITDEDYQYAHKVWKEFHFESMTDYHKLYYLSDVLLLADIFENCRSNFMQTLWIGSSLVFQRTWSCLGCYFKNYKGSTRITKRS